MERQSVFRPSWYLKAVLVSWRLWAFGTYTSRRGKWQGRFIAFGPLRFVFVQHERGHNRLFKRSR